MDGFRHEAKTVLSGKLGKDEANLLLEKKYDVETALVIESSITDCVMQVSQMESELVGVTHSLIYVYLSWVVFLGLDEVSY